MDSLPRINKKRNDVEILIPASYRGAKLVDYNKMYSENWFDFYYEKGYYLKSAVVNLESSFDDCSGDSTLCISSGRNSILMIKGLSPKSNKIRSVKLNKERVWVGEKFTFTFNSQSYTLTGEGTTIKHDSTYLNGGDKLDRWNTVKDYKLSLAALGASDSQLLIRIANFDDTFVKILWIGDLDEDNKPDLIVNTSPNYEMNRIELFLSSGAKDGELVRLADTSEYRFDC